MDAAPHELRNGVAPPFLAATGRSGRPAAWSLTGSTSYFTGKARLFTFTTALVGRSVCQPPATSTTPRQVRSVGYGHVTVYPDSIAVAEPILFSIYGQENIIRQRPYKVRLEKGCRYLSGTPPAAVGGTFYRVIEASNCWVHTLFHTK